MTATIVTTWLQISGLFILLAVLLSVDPKSRWVRWMLVLAVFNAGMALTWLFLLRRAE